jgi:hypothetical protein
LGGKAERGMIVSAICRGMNFYSGWLLDAAVCELPHYNLPLAFLLPRAIQYFTPIASVTFAQTYPSRRYTRLFSMQVSKVIPCSDDEDSSYN